ncbi:MAG: hypothetical protein KDN19_03825 [Verrucomicrobiae bacterium]|nr:hypothetical protein [Verrucomicrobiae bacterium]
MKRLAVSISIVISLTEAANGSESGSDIQDAVERALPYLEEEGTWWIEEKACVSCHHSTFFVWAKDLALKQGYSVEKGALEQQRNWVVESFLTPIEPDPKQPDNQPKPGEVQGDRNVEGVSQLLVSASADQLRESTKERLLKIVADNRNDDGNWAPGGQLPRQKRPRDETQAVSNQWAISALGVKPIDDSYSAAKTTEWFAMNAYLRKDAASLNQLLARQNPDGGWSWIDGEGSDPEATGQALFALGRSRVKDDRMSEVISRARDFLIQGQAEDGHWETKSTKDRTKSTRVSDFWGSAWAVIGLLEAGI